MVPQVGDELILSDGRIIQAVFVVVKVTSTTVYFKNKHTSVNHRWLLTDWDKITGQKHGDWSHISSKRSLTKDRIGYILVEYMRGIKNARF